MLIFNFLSSSSLSALSSRYFLFSFQQWPFYLRTKTDGMARRPATAFNVSVRVTGQSMEWTEAWFYTLDRGNGRNGRMSIFMSLTSDKLDWGFPFFVLTEKAVVCGHRIDNYHDFHDYDPQP